MRIKIIHSLSFIIDTAIQEFFCNKMGMTEEMIQASKIKIETFGSDRLGTNSPKGDVDLLCIGPRSLSRYDFCHTITKCLAECPNAKNICHVSDAYVPLIKCVFQEIEFDILYARLLLPTTLGVDVDMLLHDQILAYMDEKCILSLGGYRVTMMLIKFISALYKQSDSEIRSNFTDFNSKLLSSSTSNYLNFDYLVSTSDMLLPSVLEKLKLMDPMKVFQLSIIYLKYWAKQRAIYGNKYGFLGGIQLSIMLA